MWCMVINKGQTCPHVSGCWPRLKGWGSTPLAMHSN